jgi:predicted nucleic acid-binding protein
MKAAVVDTGWCRCCSRETPGPRAYRVHFAGRLLGISFMTLAELERWSLERAWGPRRKLELAEHVSHYAVLPVSRGLCVKWAEVGFAAKRRRRPIQTADAWIAASALYYHVPLTTNNKSDYSFIEGLTLLSA